MSKLDMGHGGAMRTYWVYILASQPHGTLYIGVTKDLLGRVEAHRRGEGSRFTSRYTVRMLVRYEPFARIEDAIQREKALKRYLRDWKTNLIERDNPHWEDLYPAVRALSATRATQRREGWVLGTSPRMTVERAVARAGWAGFGQ